MKQQIFFIILFLFVFSSYGQDYVEGYPNKNLWIFNSKAYVCSDTGQFRDTLACLTWCDSLKYGPTTPIYSNQPMYMIYDKNGICWCEITYKERRGWIKYEDVTLCKKIIPGVNYAVYLKATFGDGLMQWKYPVILSKSNKLVKDLRNTESFDEGYWVDNNKYFVFSDFSLLYSYSTIDNEVKIIDAAHAIFWDKDISRVIYLPQYFGLNRIVLKSINADGSDKKTIYDKIHPDYKGLGCHDGETDVENLKVEYLNDKKCYSFCAGFDEGYPYISTFTLLIDTKGNLLEKRERKE